MKSSYQHLGRIHCDRTRLSCTYTGLTVVFPTSQVRRPRLGGRPVHGSRAGYAHSGAAGTGRLALPEGGSRGGYADTEGGAGRLAPVACLQSCRLKLLCVVRCIDVML